MKNKQNNWQKIKLGDAAGEVRNLYNPSPGEHLKYIGLEHIKQNTLRLSSIGDSADTQSAKKFFSTNDVLFGSLRAYFRKVVKPKFNGVCSTDITVLRSKNGNDQNFLYYFIANPHFIDFAAASAEGTRMPRVSWKFLSKTQWNFPPSADQKRISDILSAFDDKIELNNKISKNLEQTAQVVFKEWFIKFKYPGHEKVKMVDSELGKIPEGWEVKNFVELLKLKHGHGFKSEEFGEERTNRVLVRMGNFKETGGLQFDDNTKYLKSDAYNKKDQLLPNDLVMVLSDITRDGRIIGRVGLVPKDEKVYLLNQRVAKIETEEKFKLFLFFYFNSKKFKEHCLSRADSATVLNLKNDHIYEIKAAVPDDNILDKFNGLVLPIFKKSREIEVENQKLTALRDLLLPKLMSGEIV